MVFKFVDLHTVVFVCFDFFFTTSDDIKGLPMGLYSGITPGNAFVAIAVPEIRQESVVCKTNGFPLYYICGPYCEFYLLVL